MNLKQNSRMYGLDVLRGLAALWVLMFHYVELAPAPFKQSIDSIFLHMGWNGVDLFFILSGFLIGSIIIKAQHYGAAGFLVRRFFRIYPAYILMVILCLWLTRQELIGNTKLLIAHILMIHQWIPGFGGAINGVLWTLGTEFEFYIIAAIIFCFPQRVSAWWWIVAVMVAISMISRAVVYACNDNEMHRFFWATQLYGMLGMFAVGFAIAKIRPYLEAWIQKHFLFLCVIGVVLLAVFLYWMRRHLGNYWGFPHSVIFGRFYSSLVFGYLVLIFSSVPACMEALFKKTGAAFLGDISYGIYLVHLPVMEKLSAFFLLYFPHASSFIYLSSVLICVLILASLIYFGVEKPFILLGKKLVAYLSAKNVIGFRPTRYSSIEKYSGSKP